MANNRLILVYRPTGRAVGIGKRMGSGWYTGHGSVDERLTAFFDEVESEWMAGMGQDDFELVIEDAERAPALSDDWTYDGSGPTHIKRNAPDNDI